MINRLRQALQSNKLQLFVSLPANDAALARAAVQAGADGLKVHIRADHRASGNRFGPLEQYLDSMLEIRSLFGGPLGIVPGDSINGVQADEIAELADIGIDFYSIYAFHLPSFMLKDHGVARTFAVNDTFDLKLTASAPAFGMDALEASVVPGAEYGTKLSFADLLKYRWLVDNAGVPVIVPSQRKIVAEDIRPLMQCGIKALLIGSVVTGKTADEIARAVSTLRNEIDK